MYLGALLLTWFSAALFALFIMWGMDVQMKRRPRVVFWIAGLIFVFNLFAQTAFFQSEKGLTQALDGGSISRQTAAELHDVLARWAMQPGELRGNSSIGQWMKVVTSTMLHYGWIPLFFNLWFIILFGHVLEGLLGWLRFVPLVCVGLTVPAALEGYLPPIPGASAGHYYGGASGLVYTLIGAGLVVFPRGRCAVAINYDGRFWAIALCILLPVTTLTARAGLPLTEMIMLVGMIGVFLLLQPICSQLWAPVWGVALYKLVQDLLFIEPVTHNILSNSLWRIGGGLLLGMASGVAVDGLRGFHRKWHDDPPKRKRHNSAKQSSLKEMETKAQTDFETARRYLGQRVFVADAERVVQFYRDVVIPDFPELVLPATEQMALARLLHSKGREAEALHAYENLLKNYEIDIDRWEAWLITAELLQKVNPNRRHDLRGYLERFLQGSEILMRDRLEAERMLRETGDDETETVEELTGKAVESKNAEAGARLDQEVPAGPTAQTQADANQPARETTQEPGPKRPEPKENAGVPTVDFPRLVPRTFEVLNGQPTTAATRSKPRYAGELAPGNMSQVYWKPLELQSSYKLDDERLLLLKSHGSRKATVEQSSGHYAGAGLREEVGESEQRKAGRLAHIEVMKGKTRAGQPPPGADSESPGQTVDGRNEKIPSNYGVSATPTDRPRIRLRSETGPDSKT